MHIARSLEGNRTDTPTITQVDDPPSLCSGRKSFVRTKSYLEIQDIKERRAAFWLQDTEQGPRGPARAASCLPRCSRAEAGRSRWREAPPPSSSASRRVMRPRRGTGSWCPRATCGVTFAETSSAPRLRTKSASSFPRAHLILSRSLDTYAVPSLPRIKSKLSRAAEVTVPSPVSTASSGTPEAQPGVHRIFGDPRAEPGVHCVLGDPRAAAQGPPRPQ